MTTIACDGKSMSSDSLESAGDTITGYHVKKLWKLEDGRIVGLAGKVSEIHRFLEWIQSEEAETTHPPKLKDCSALVMDVDGTVELFDGEGVMLPCELPAALGTGYISALTAMDMGADTKTAVKMAIKRDVFTGGAIQTITL